MKSLVVLLAVTAASASLPALAQSYGPAGAFAPAPITTPAPTSTPAPGPSPSASAAGSPSATTGGAASSVPLPGNPSGPTLERTMPLIPETAPPSSGRRHGRKSKSRKSGDDSGLDASPTPHDTFGVEQDIRLHIRIREAQTRAANDRSVQADWVAAHNTRTDPARREALKRYYNHLYDRMIQIDPSVTDLANFRRHAVIDRMYSSRLGEEAPDENAFAVPAPQDEGKNPPLPGEPASP